MSKVEEKLLIKESKTVDLFVNRLAELLIMQIEENVQRTPLPTNTVTDSEGQKPATNG